MTWIQTSLGRKFDFEDPNPQSVHILDIANSLAKLCRFTGHSKEFYSVAQHSVIVSYVCAEENALVGLLHDSTEAYVGDMSRPLKKVIPEFQKFENQIWTEAIAPAFDLPSSIPDDVKTADDIALQWEVNWLMGGTCSLWGIEDPESTPRVPSVPLVPLDPSSALEAFMVRFDELWGDYL